MQTIYSFLVIYQERIRRFYLFSDDQNMKLWVDD